VIYISREVLLVFDVSSLINYSIVPEINTVTRWKPAIHDAPVSV
jgi:hypothetical protein